MNLTGTAEVVRKYLDDAFDARTPVMVLRWDGGDRERLWDLPEGLCVTGPAPAKLGLCVRRLDAAGRYAVRLLWDRTTLAWPDVSRTELLACCLGPLLAAAGLDLWSLLEHQPAARLRSRAA
jgi:hypothetical protein